MNYNFSITDDIAKDIYNLDTFDVEWGGSERAFERIIRFLESHRTLKAIAVCTETIAGREENKAFDRGYVKGIDEICKLFRDGKIIGRKMQGHTNKVNPPKIV